MNTSTYDQSGNYIAYAGLAVSILGHFGINTTVDDVAAVIGAVVIIVGLVKQFIAHKKLAKVAGAIR